ncbi:MAG: ATP-binding cassette domain-containing protein [Deltaproteobacteria bacterium]|nr:ATP-binding cassette domain-containing protein [Deltaproteobacteria bacterium]
MPAIHVENLSKEYFIGREAKADSVRELLSSIFSPSALRLRNSGKRRQERFWALKDVSFEVAQGEVVGIIGRNGAGKSTLLKILSRITEPTTGRAELWGRVSSLLEVGTGFHPELTGRENIFLNGSLLGMTRREIERKFDEIVAFSEVERFIDTPVKRFSSGMHVRLAFAVAAHLEPEILIVDEVLAVGDNAFQKKCLGKMEEAGKEGRTILFVSHNLGAIKALCSRGIVLQAGTVLYDGEALAAVSRYAGNPDADVVRVRWGTPDAPSLPSAVLIEAGLLNDGKPAGTDISTELPIQVQVTFRVLKEARIGTTVLLYNSDGALVLASISNHEPVWHGKVRRKGVYRSVCEIPPNFLAEGRYTISIPFWEGFYETGIVERDVLRFTAHEKGLVRGDLPYEMKDSAIRPLLSWKSDYLGEWQD